MSFILGYDPETLREKVDPRQCRDRLEAIGQLRSLPALLERVWLLKVLDQADEALEISEESVRVARMAGTRKDLLRARILHSSILQARGTYLLAEKELTTCLAEAEAQGWPAIMAFGHLQRGKVHYDAGNFEAARTDFKRALFLRQEGGAAEEDLKPTLIAIEAAERRYAQAVAS